MAIELVRKPATATNGGEFDGQVVYGEKLFNIATSSANLAAIANNTFTIAGTGNEGVFLVAKTSAAAANRPLTITAMGDDAQAQGDMVFDARTLANGAFTTTTSDAYRFRVAATNIATATRAGAWTFSNIHFTSNPQGNLNSGTYTATLTNGANVAASTFIGAQYMRVGNVVTVSGQVQIDPTATSGSTILRISLPITSTFASTQQLAGTGVGDNSGAAYSPARIYGDVGSSRAVLEFLANADVANRQWAFQFTYVIV